MRIYKMTATFGKLSHETLTLQPGMNIIEAPNEWGKSTWCAFLIAMLYGIDTASRSKKDFLSEKEHYAPWSGEPMSGSMDLQFQGRDITIERKNKGRAVFGDFRAYETDSGLPVRELTAGNCGLTLLGVERNVFLRAGFLRLADLPVTQDETLRSRLNRLVTTGDESSTAEALAEKLKELKNRCSYRSSGLLPQTVQQWENLRVQLQTLTRLQEKQKTVICQIRQLEKHRTALLNHQAHLQYEKNRDLVQQLQQLQSRQDELQQQTEVFRRECERIPDRDILKRQLEEARQLMERQRETPSPQETPDFLEQIFRGMDGNLAVEKARADAENYRRLMERPPRHGPVLWILGAVLAAAGPVFLLFSRTTVALLCLLTGAGMILAWILRNSNWKNICESKKLQAQILESRYEPLEVSRWEEEAGHYRDRQKDGSGESLNHSLQMEIRTLTDGKSLPEFVQAAMDGLQKHQKLADSMAELSRTKQLILALGQTEVVTPPAGEDGLTDSEQDTEQKLADVQAQLKLQQQLLGQCRGQMDSLPPEEQLRRQLRKTEERRMELEKTDRALKLAMEVQEEAAQHLQRRFAPRISQRAGERMAELTGSRYDRVMLGQDLQLQSGAKGEDVLHSPLWRSDGTADQLYLALRLAVAEELTPNAPLILDDALVRFDDSRLTAALKLLQEESSDRQVILFTCQSRENRIYSTF